MMRLQALVDIRRCFGSGFDDIEALGLVREVGAAKKVMVVSRGKTT